MSATVGKALVAMIVIQFLVLWYVYDKSYKGSDELKQAQRNGCSRAQLDRQDSIDFMEAQMRHLETLEANPTTPEGVKQSARIAVVTFERVTDRLATRNKIVCAQVYP